MLPTVKSYQIFKNEIIEILKHTSNTEIILHNNIFYSHEDICNPPKYNEYFIIILDILRV